MTQRLAMISILIPGGLHRVWDRACKMLFTVKSLIMQNLIMKAVELLDNKWKHQLRFFTFPHFHSLDPAVKGTLWTRIGLGLVHYGLFWELSNFLSNVHYRVVSLVRTLTHR